LYALFPTVAAPRCCAVPHAGCAARATFTVCTLPHRFCAFNHAPLDSRGSSTTPAVTRRVRITLLVCTFFALLPSSHCCGCCSSYRHRITVPHRYASSRGYSSSLPADSSSQFGLRYLPLHLPHCLTPHIYCSCCCLPHLVTDSPSPVLVSCGSH